MPERKHAGAPDAVLARPLSLPSDPVATGRPRPGHQRPRARKRGARKSVNLNPGGPSRSSSIAPAETILRRARFFGTHAPRDKEHQPEKCRRESTPEPDAVLARPLSLPSYPVATGRPRPGHQRPRALRVRKRVNAGPDAVLARPISLPSYPVATGRPRPGHQRPRALRELFTPQGF